MATIKSDLIKCISVQRKSTQVFTNQKKVQRSKQSKSNNIMAFTALICQKTDKISTGIGNLELTTPLSTLGFTLVRTHTSKLMVTFQIPVLTATRISRLWMTILVQQFLCWYMQMKVFLIRTSMAKEKSKESHLWKASILALQSHLGLQVS